MKTSIVFILLMGSMLNNSAQQPAIDSLLGALQSATLPDTTRWQLLKKAADYYGDENTEKGILMAREALAIAGKIKDKHRQAESYKALAFNQSQAGNDSLAQINYGLALNLYRQNADSLNAGKILHSIGLLNFEASNFYTAIDFHSKALSIFENLGETERMARAINSIGVNYLYTGNYPKALDCYFKSYQLNEKVADKAGMANALTNIGLVYNRTGSYKKALENHRQSLTIFQQIADKNGVANALANMGIVYDNLQQPAKAVEYYQLALNEYKSIDNKRGIARTLTNIAIAEISLQQYTKALDNLQQSVAIYTETGDKNSLAIAYSYIGDTYFKLPDTLLKKMALTKPAAYAKALDYTQQSLQLGKELETVSTQAEAWGSLAGIYEGQKNYAAALHAFKQYKTLGDSLLNDDKKEALTRSEMQFEQDKKEAVLAASHAAELKEQRLKKYAALGSTFVLLLASVSSFIFYKRKRDAGQKVKEADFTAKVADTEMKALRAQMNPHFIFNSLNSITDYIDRQDARTASYFTAKFAKLMRMILENSEKKEIALEDDLKALELYMQLEALRMNGKFGYEIDLDDEIDAANTLVPPLLLQPFVENSIWHGLAKKEAGGKILVSVGKEGEMVVCTVEDNGVGRRQTAFEAQDKSAKKSMGMKITMERIEIVNQLKKTNATVEIHDLAQGTRVVLKIPLTLAF